MDPQGAVRRHCFMFHVVSRATSFGNYFFTAPDVGCTGHADRTPWPDSRTVLRQAVVERVKPATYCVIDELVLDVELYGTGCQGDALHAGQHDQRDSQRMEACLEDPSETSLPYYSQGSP